MCEYSYEYVCECVTVYVNNNFYLSFSALTICCCEFCFILI